jgi:exonuclease VII small subunit
VKTSENKSFEENFKILKTISEKISNEDLSVDDVITKGKEASAAARLCLEILKKERGSFKKLEEELAELSGEVEKFTDEEEGE